mmetsp:Transcript_19549/g.32817  ORF Transcript_19549/g.32817 Transcript_19549/m.32817 type:complete len:208 (+) Transcript_19549:758-1381(+)
MSFSETLTHAAEIHRNFATFSNFIPNGLPEAGVAGRIIDPVDVEGPVLFQAGALHLQCAEGTSQGHALIARRQRSILSEELLISLATHVVNEEPRDVIHKDRATFLHGVAFAHVLIGAADRIGAAAVGLRLVFHGGHVVSQVDLCRHPFRTSFGPEGCYLHRFHCMWQHPKGCEGLPIQNDLLCPLSCCINQEGKNGPRPGLRTNGG